MDDNVRGNGKSIVIDICDDSCNDDENDEKQLDELTNGRCCSVNSFTKDWMNSYH